MATVSTLLNCSRKIYTVGIHDQGSQESLSDVERKSLLGIWLQVYELNSGIPLRQTRVRLRPEAISGTPLLEQEFALREAAVGKWLEIRIDSYTDRKNEYTLKLAVKCSQNNYAKAEAIIAVQA